MSVGLPAVEIVRVEPAGMAGPNPGRNRGLRAARSEWVLLIDDDTHLTEGCLEALLDEAGRFPDAGAIAPRAVRFEDPDIVQYDGARAHFLGEMGFENYWTAASELRRPSREIGAASTTALLVRRRAALEAGLFDESLVFCRVDLDFCLRLRRAGWRLRFRPDARVVHGGAPRGPLHAVRARLQARNRWLVLFKTMTLRGLILTLPAQLAYEAVSLAGGVVSGSFVQRLHGLAEAAGLAPAALARRRPESRMSDARLFGAPDLTWSPAIMARPGATAAARAASALARAWWRLVSPWLA